MLGDFARRFTGLGPARTFVDVRERPGATELRSDGDVPTVVAIHGFTGTPGEVELCLEPARKRGLATRAPLLAGHGTNAGELARTDYKDWLASAQVAFDEARARGPVILVGLSLGSVIATELCLRAPGDVAGLALLSNAFWLMPRHPGLSLRLAGLIDTPDWFMEKDGADIGHVQRRASHVTYDAQPIRAAIEVEKAGRRVRKELFRVHRPTLIIHGARDAVCPVRNSWRVAASLGTRDSRVVVLPRSKHIITKDADREALREELGGFFDRVSRGARPW